MENDQNSNYYKVSGIVFVGCMFIGMGVGEAFGETGIGMFIGMGVGFLASAFLKMRNN